MKTLPLTDSPKSICLLRLSAIGDVTHALPLLRTLQKQWPNCQITWIIGKTEASLVDDIEGVEFIIFDKKAGLKAYWHCWELLRKRKFDLLLHMQVALRANLLSLLVKAPLKIGYDNARSRDGHRFFVNRQIQAVTKQHVLEGFMEFANVLGVNKHILQWQIPIPAQAQTMMKNRVDSSKPILIINPCSSMRIRNYRNWPADRYAKLADYAAEKFNFQVVLTGGPQPNEQAMAESICHLAKSSICNLVGKTTLKELLALLDMATVLVAPDTGPAHMATAVGTPVVGLYASSNPMRTGPYLSLDHVVNVYADALSKYCHKSIDQAHWGERVRDPNVMQLISVDAVIEKLTTITSTT